jgi:hypothetical protein
MGALERTKIELSCVVELALTVALASSTCAESVVVVLEPWRGFLVCVVREGAYVLIHTVTPAPLKGSNTRRRFSASQRRANRAIPYLELAVPMTPPPP